MRLRLKIMAISSLLVVPFVLSACTSGNFTSASNKKAATDATNPPAGSPDNDAVSVPVGGQKPLSDIVAGDLKSCTSADPSIATVDASTCTLTGIKVGSTNVNAVLADGSRKNVTVTVTPTATPGVTVAVGGQQSVPGGGTSCTSANKTIATVDPQTCVVTGVNAGNTNVQVTQADGTVQSVPVVVTGDDTVDPNGDLITTDGETSITGRVCLGGPACNISYVTRTEADAQTCMQVANSQTCQNDSSCGSADQLQVCNCDCESATALPFTTPEACRRTNPLKPGAIERIAECHAI